MCLNAFSGLVVFTSPRVFMGDSSPIKAHSLAPHALILGNSVPLYQRDSVPLRRAAPSSSANSR